MLEFNIELYSFSGFGELGGHPLGIMTLIAAARLIMPRRLSRPWPAPEWFCLLFFVFVVASLGLKTDFYARQHML